MNQPKQEITIKVSALLIADCMGWAGLEEKPTAQWIAEFLEANVPSTDE